MIFLPDDTERERIIKALNQAHGRRQGAADKQGISKSGLFSVCSVCRSQEDASAHHLFIVL